MTEKPEIGSKEQYIDSLNSALRELDLPDYGSKPFDELLEVQLRVLDLEGVHTQEEAFVGLLAERAKQDGLADGTIVHFAARQWDNLHGTQAISLARAVAPLKA